MSNPLYHDMGPEFLQVYAEILKKHGVDYPVEWEEDDA